MALWPVALTLQTPSRENLSRIGIFKNTKFNDIRDNPAPLMALRQGNKLSNTSLSPKMQLK